MDDAEIKVLIRVFNYGYKESSEIFRILRDGNRNDVKREIFVWKEKNGTHILKRIDTLFLGRCYTMNEKLFETAGLILRYAAKTSPFFRVKNTKFITGSFVNDYYITTKFIAM